MAVNNLTRGRALDTTAARSTTQAQFRQGIGEVIAKADVTPTDLTLEIDGTEYGITRSATNEDEWTITLPVNLPADGEPWSEYGSVITSPSDGSNIEPADPVLILPETGLPDREVILPRPEVSEMTTESITNTRRVSSSLSFEIDMGAPGASISGGQDTVMLIPGYYEQPASAWNDEVPTSYLQIADISRVRAPGAGAAGTSGEFYNAGGAVISPWARRNFPNFPDASFSGRRRGGRIGFTDFGDFENMPVNFFDRAGGLTVIIFRRRRRLSRSTSRYETSPPGHEFADDRALFTSRGIPVYPEAGIGWWYSFDFGRRLFSGGRGTSVAVRNRRLPEPSYNTVDVTQDTNILPTTITSRQARNALIPTQAGVVSTSEQLQRLETNAGALARITGRDVESSNGSRVLAGFRVFNGIDEWF